LRAGICVWSLAAEGIEVGIVADDAGVGGYVAGSAEQVFDVINGGAAGGKHGDTLAAEETYSLGLLPEESVSFGGKRVAMLPAKRHPIFTSKTARHFPRHNHQHRRRLLRCRLLSLRRRATIHKFLPAKLQNSKARSATLKPATTIRCRYLFQPLRPLALRRLVNRPRPVPYANLTNPQTLNLYAMVADDPNPSPTSTVMMAGNVAWGVLNSLASTS